MTSILITKSASYNAFASSISPSFPRQLVTDASNDWYIFPAIGGSNLNCSEIKNIPYPDLSTVSYMSDGKFLNVTFWLTGPFDNNPTTSLFRSPTYSMSIGLISDYRNLTIDYTLSISWDPISGTWTNTIEELLPDDRRILHKIPNYNVSFDNTPVTRIASSVLNNTEQEISKGHLNLSLDLGALNYPDRYFLTFGVADTVRKKGVGGGICGVFDISDNAAFIPPPKFIISTLQGPIALRPNDNRTIEVRVNSTIPSAPKVSFSPVSINGLELNFDPENQNLTNDGFATSNLHLKVLENAIRNGEEEVSYTIPIKATIYFPKVEVNSALNTTINSRNASQSIDITQKISPKPYYLTLTVLRSLNFQEYLGSIVKEWIVPIKELWAFLAAVGALIAVIIRKYRKK